MNIKIIAGLSLSLLASFVPLTVLAQDQSPTNTPSPQMQATVLANLNVVNVTSSESNGTWTGQYTLQGEMGLQNDIDVGIVAYDSHNRIVDTKPLEHNLSIQQGELRPLTFSYTLPTYVSGKVTVSLLVQTSTGIPLSYAPLGSATATANSTQSGLSCDIGTGTSVSIVCTSKESGTLAVSYSARGLFSQSAPAGSKTITKGGRVTFTPSLAPGKYLAHITFTTTGEMSVVPFTMPGKFGSISSVIVSSDTTGSLHTVVSASMGTKESATVTIHLTDTSGADCGSATTPLLGQNVASFDMKTSCESGSVLVTLVDATGVSLATKTEPFSVIAFVPPTTAPTSTSSSTSTLPALLSSWYVIAGIVLLIVLGGAFWYYQNKKNAMQESTMGITDATRMMSIALLLLSSFGLFAPRASALTVTLQCYPSNCPNMNSGIFAVYRLDLASYTAGDPVTFVTFFSSDDQPYPSSGISLDAHIATSPNAWSTTDLYPGVTAPADLVAANVNASMMVGTAPSTPGSYSAKASVSAGFYVVPPAGTLNFTVTAAPTVNVHF